MDQVRGCHEPALSAHKSQGILKWISWCDGALAVSAITHYISLSYRHCRVQRSMCNTVGDNMSILDLDLELDLNVNVISPMWPENDFLAKDLTDAILTDELSFTSTASTSATNTDFTWNTVQGLEHLCYEDIRLVGDDALYTNDQLDQKPDALESWSDTCSLDSLFELEIFSECLKDVDSAPSTETDPFAEWNRRRSLLYDKNEFVQSASQTAATTATAVPSTRNRKAATSSSSTCLPTSTSTVDQRTFRCSVRDCDKTYYKASHLKSHMRRHSGVKPFACDWDGCKWRFSRSDELARHKRSHSGIKPYSCNLCDKAFSRSDHLSKHAKVHMKKMALYGTPIITKKCNYKYLTVNRIPVE